MRKNRITADRRKGMALLVVLSIIIILFVLGAAVLMISTSHFGISFNQIKRTQAFYATEAGFVDALWQLRPNVTPSFSFPPTFGNPSRYSVYHIGRGKDGYPAKGYTAEVVILLPGDSYSPATGEQYHCPANCPSDYCLNIRVTY